MKLTAIMFYPGDWLRDDVSGCSLSAQGLWLRMMILMHDSERYGHLCLNGSPIPPESISRRCGCDSLAQYETLLAELESARVPSRTNNGILFSRRMVKDDKKRRDARIYGKKGGNPSLKKTLNPILKGSIESEVDMKLKTQKKGEIEGKDIPLFPFLDDPSAKKAWEDWQSHIKEKKVKTTSKATEGQIEKCKAWGLARTIAALRHSVASNYQGIFEPNSNGLVKPSVRSRNGNDIPSASEAP